MNQEKIGKFIAELRKENKLTQQELAEKLGVSDRTIGNWENGRNLPDPSLFKPLCSTLKITLTELFNGERIKEEELVEKTDEVLTNVIKHSKIDGVLQIISSIVITIGMILFFIPTLKGFNQMLSIITISVGICLVIFGLSLKSTVWERSNNKTIKNTGMGFTSGLTLLFITLKLTDHIDWSWIWVLSPLWIGTSLVIILLIIIFTIDLIVEKIKKKKKQDKS